MRRMIVVLIAVALAVGVFVFWPRTDVDDPPVTAAAGTTTTTTEPLDTTTSAPSASTTLGDGSHVVETEDEAEEILRELWFGWFEGIYNQDEDRIREVVGNPNQVEAAVEQFGEMEFDNAPTSEAIVISDMEILRSDESCLAIWGNVEAGFRDGALAGVHVFRSDDGRWLLINTWPLRGDLWSSDCEVSLDTP